MELDGARATLADLGSKTVQRLFRNNVTMMTNKLTSVAAEHDNVVRELDGKQDCLIDKVLSLRNDTTELVDKLARVAKMPG